MLDRSRSPLCLLDWISTVLLPFRTHAHDQLPPNQFPLVGQGLSVPSAGIRPKRRPVSSPSGPADSGVKLPAACGRNWAVFCQQQSTTRGAPPSSPWETGIIVNCSPLKGVLAGRGLNWNFTIVYIIHWTHENHKFYMYCIPKIFSGTPLIFTAISDLLGHKTCSVLNCYKNIEIFRYFWILSTMRVHVNLLKKRF